MYHIKCLNPSYIANPSIKDFIRFCRLVYLFDCVHDIRPEQISDVIRGISPLKVFNVRHPNNIPFDCRFGYCSQFYFITADSEIKDFFLEVPCGHCAICRESYISSVKQRVMFGLQESRCVPLFVTLTYKSDKQPLRGPDMRQIQLFKKRLKKNVKDFFGYDPKPIKILVASEFGKNHNLHYHLLILGFPQLYRNKQSNQFERFHFFEYLWRQPQYFYNVDDVSPVVEHRNPISYKRYKELYPQIFSRPSDYDDFSLGFVNVEEVSNSSNVVSYITKYILKGCKTSLSSFELPSDNPFVQAVGNRRERKHIFTIPQKLGVDFVQKLSINKDGSVSFVNWMDNQLHTIYLSNYYIKILYPSYSSLVPAEIRRSFDYVMEDISTLLSNPRLLPNDIKASLLSTSIYLNNNLPEFSFVPSPDYNHFIDDNQLNCILSSIAYHTSILYNFILNVDFHKIHLQVLSRDKFLSKLSLLCKSTDPVIMNNYLSHKLSHLQTKIKI